MSDITERVKKALSQDIESLAWQHLAILLDEAEQNNVDRKLIISLAAKLDIVEQQIFDGGR